MHRLRRISTALLILFCILQLCGCAATQELAPAKTEAIIPSAAPALASPTPAMTEAVVPIPKATPTNTPQATSAPNMLVKGSPITEADFVITLHDEAFDLLRDSPDKLESMLGGNWAKREPEEGGAFFEMETELGVFTYPEGDAEALDTADLGEGVYTARGIKIGSNMDQMLAAYPKPKSIEHDGGEAIYTFLEVPKKPLTPPKNWFIITIVVDGKSSKVTSIVFVQTYL